MNSPQSIRDYILTTLTTHLQHIRTVYSVEKIGIFGSVARGEDTPASDVDILFTFQKDCVSLDKFLDLADYLETIFSRKVDLIHDDGLSPYMTQQVNKEVIWAK